MDIALSALALLLLSPLFAVIALLVVLDSRGPVFFRADRVGFRGRPLRMLKFRKMRTGASGVALTVAGDERLTRLGAWLVRTKLDELPQLWHVLRGEMSLVGPRPESPDFVARFRTDYDVILRVRPGITGYTQLAFAREGAILDRLYASRMSIRRDLSILVATFVTLVLRQPVAVHRDTAALSLRRRTSNAVLEG